MTCERVEPMLEMSVGVPCLPVSVGGEVHSKSVPTLH